MGGRKGTAVVSSSRKDGEANSPSPPHLITRVGVGYSPKKIDKYLQYQERTEHQYNLRSAQFPV